MKDIEVSPLQPDTTVLRAADAVDFFEDDDSTRVRASAIWQPEGAIHRRSQEHSLRAGSERAKARRLRDEVSEGLDESEARAELIE